MKSLMSVLDEESKYCNPLVGDTIAVRHNKQEIDMVVIGRKWRGNTLLVELHAPKHFSTLSTFESYVNYRKSL